jgi:hypothetical protein
MIGANSSPVRGPGETQFGGYVRGRDPVVGTQGRERFGKSFDGGVAQVS